MLKKALSMFLTFCIVLSLLPTQGFAANGGTTEPNAAETTAVSSNPFGDVRNTDWYFNAVQYVREHNFFSGTSEDAFTPDGTMTRGMFVTVLGRMAGVNTANYAGRAAFGDVSDSIYYATFVAWASENGITNGTGDGNFDPDVLINREQMAVFLVRYFEIFDVEYDTGANITTIPQDIDTVSPYARDAVLKLWKTGLLNGDGMNFNPGGNATRAQAATLCMRTDKSVETWYSEPGVPSERDKPADESKPSSGNNVGGESTIYYEVKFQATNGESDATMPETKTYALGTKLSALPTPYKHNCVFMGWYYDEDLSEAAENGDIVSRNMTLYAKFADGEVSLQELDTPNYITATDVATSFTFEVKAVASDAVASDAVEAVKAVKKALTIKNVTANNETVTYTVEDGSSPFTFLVSAVYAAGQTYKAELTEDSTAVFIYDDEEQPVSVRVLNFTTYMEEVLKLGLSDSIKYKSVTDVTNMTGKAFDGLFNLNIKGATLSAEENGSDGTFIYSGNDVSVGDTVAIYSGTRPDKRDLDTTGESNDGDVAYVTITAISGTTYSYTSADSEDVLFTPDVLPIISSADTDDVANQITVPASVLDFSGDQYAELGLDSQTTVDVGDFIVFYTSDTGEFDITAENATYAEINTVSSSGDNYVITYDNDIEQKDVIASMDAYHTRNEDVELTDTEIQQMEADMETQAIESGFVEEAAKYLTALALETDGFQELSGDMDLKSYSITMSDGTPMDEGEMALMSGSKVEITKNEIVATVAAGKVLQHFDGSSGVRAELAMTFTVEITPASGSENKIEITLQAIFEQEILLNVNVSGGAIWKWKWIFPYIYDYRLNANFDVGTFTGIGITATAKTVGAADDDEYDWKAVTGNKYEEKIINIGKQITELMEAKETFLGEKMIDENGEEIEWSGSNGGGLAEKYSAMIENAESSWIELFRKEIFNVEGSVDPFHILVFGISADFVVSANMYVTMGMTFEYGNAKRYNFSLTLFHKGSTSETIDLEPAHYQFDFYVMGTLGIRAGVELEVAIGLFSLKLDSIGITAEVGAYAQLWGYFYYHYLWEKGTNGAPDTRESSSSGAMLIEIGIYLKITFKAQLFSSSKLTYQPTLLDKQWPLLTIGEAENVYDFNYSEDDTPSFDIKTVRSFTLPTSLFEMQYMDLQSGEIFGGEDADGNHPALNCDDGTESHFIIKFSNSAFKYNPETNTVTVTASSESTGETGEMTIIWKSGTLAFTSRSISRTVSIKWADPTTGRYIAFDSNGGSPVQMIFKNVGTTITQPTNPTKQGYDFAGWYTDTSCTTPFTFPSKMPDYAQPQRGITVYAKWAPAFSTYHVEHYFQELNGQYTLDSTRTQTITNKKTGEMTAATEMSVTGFKSRSFSQKVISANGSTLVSIYYERIKKTATFSYGDLESEENQPIIYTYKYGAAICAPTLALGGYFFDGWDSAVPAIMPDSDVNYTAKWKPDPNTPYRVENYFQNISGDDYTYVSMESKSGSTGASLTVSSLVKPSEGMTYDRATVDGNPVTATKIKADGSLVIKLYYTRNSANVTFNSQGGSSVSALSGVRYGAAVTKPGNPSKTGYTFDGWYTDVSCTDGNAFDFNLNKMTAGNLTLYAKWTACSYTVTFDANGGAGTTAAQGFIYDTAQALTANGFARTGYTFSGWNTAAGGGGTAYADTANVINLTLASGITLYAQWTPNSYTVRFHSNNGADTSADQTFQYNESKALIANGFVRTGYSFAGWATSSDGTAVYTNSQNVVNLTAGNGAVIDLYAIWTANTYAVKFDGNGSTGGTMSNQTFTYDAAKTLTANSYTKTGYTFAGWNTEAGGGGTAYANAASAINLASGSVVTLYAQWTARTCTVTLNKQGGTGGSGSVSAAYDAAMTAISVPTRTGYNFQGYFDGQNGTGTCYYNALGGSAHIWNKTTDTTLYAYWTAGTFTIIFDAGAGTVTTTDKSVTYDSTYGTLPTPTRTGYTSDGWFTAASGGTEVESTSVVSITGAQTMYAHWTANSYTVSFNGNGSTAGSTDSQTFDYDETKNLSTNGYSRTGYTFTEWNTAYNGSGTGYADGASVSNLTAINNATVALYARWTANSYTVSFSGNGSTGGSMSDQSFSYGISKPLTSNGFSKAGYTFAGWAASADGAVVYGNSQSVSNLASANGATVTLYAKWTPGTATAYTVRHQQQNIGDDLYTVAASQTLYGTTEGLTAASANTYTGFTAQTVVQQTISGDGSTVVNVYYDRDEHDAIWNTDGGTVIGNTSYRYGKTIVAPTAPTKTGYTFSGWTWSGHTTPSLTIGVSMGAADMTFAANWQINTYTVTFNSTGGSNVTALTVNYNGTATKPANPAKIGYTFDGWYNGIEAYVFSTPVTGNLTLTAQWKLNTYTVSFNGNSSTDGSMSSQSFSYNETKNLSANGYSRTGYGFAGWSTSSGGTVIYSNSQSVSNLTDVNSATVDLYAKWTPNSYTVRFDGNGSTSGSMSSQTYNYDQSKALATNGFAKTGYTFAGWAASAEGDVVYSNSQSVSNLTAVDGASVTLYAKWMAGEATAYTVRHLQQNIDNDLYTEAEPQTLYGTTDSLTEAAANTYTGFTAQSVVQQTISGDGSTVVNVYYNRDVHDAIWNTNGGTVIGNTSYRYGKTITAPTAPTKTGYTFSGWTWSGHTTPSLTVGVSMGAADMTFTANWQINTYTVTFDAANGSAATKQTVNYNSTATKPANPTRTGYTFHDWYNGTEVYGFSSLVTGSLTLTAHWTANSYTVAFDGNGSTGGSMSSQAFTYDAAKTLTANTFTRTGYTFAGWSTSSGGAKSYDDSASVSNLTAANGTTVTLYAKWIAIGYTVSFNGNGSTGGSMSGQTFTYDVSQNLRANSFTRTGYTFAGWAASTDGSVVYSNSQSVSNLASANGATVTLYAKWAAGTATAYTVKHLQQNLDDDLYTEVSTQTLSGTTGALTAAAANTYTGFTAQTVVQQAISGDGSTVVNVYYNRDIHNAIWNTVGGTAIGNTSYRYGKTVVAPTAPAKTGYTFTGWTWSGQGTPSMTVGVNMGAADMTFTANWQLNTYTVTFNAANGSAATEQTVSYNGTASKPANPTRTGYTFLDWYSGETAYDFSTPVTGSLTLTAHWQLNTYAVTYDSAGGSSVDAQTVNYNGTVSKPADPSRLGYTFINWYNSASVYDFSTPVTGSLTLTAHWQLNTCTVTFNSAGGSSVDTQTVNYGGTASAPDAPVRTGYTFLGWYNGETVYNFNTLVTVNLTLTARWTANSYTVAFNGNGSTDSMSSQAFTYDVSQNLSANTFTRTGYTFSGWATSSGGNVNYSDIASVSNLTAVNGTTVTLYAKWTPISYTVSYDGNGSNSGSMSSQSFSYDESKNLSANGFTKIGCTFSGWNTEAGGGGTRYTGGVTVSNLTNENGAEIKLYAQWTVNQYTITFKSDSNTTYQTITQDYGTAVTPPADPGKIGYNFNGWDGSVPTTMPANSLTLTAQWTAVSYGITYDLGGGTNGSNPETYTVANSFALAYPTRDGYTFDGWTGTGLSAVTKDVAVPAGSTGARNYIANWTMINYDITVYGKDGLSYTLHGTKDATIALPATLNGSTVLGWFTDSAYQTEITNNYTVTGSGQTLYAWLYSNDNPCLLQSEEDLKLLRTMVNNGRTGWASGNYRMGYRDNQTAVITLTYWQSGIGTNTNRFTGTFDGNRSNDCKITYINNGSPSDSLFSYVGAGGTVKNVNADGYINGTITILNTTNMGEPINSLGSIAGRNFGMVTNCTFTGTMSLGTYVPTVVDKIIANCGGIVGKNEGTVSGCTLGDNTTIDATFSWFGKTSSASYVGGIVGWNCGTVAGGGAVLNGLTVIGCAEVGGIVGFNDFYCTVSDWTLANSLVISREETFQHQNIGGIAGYSYGYTNNCHLLNSSVTSVGLNNALSGTYVGGIVGTQNGVEIVNCSVSGKNSGQTYTVSGVSNVGAIVGGQWGTVNVSGCSSVNVSVSGS